MKRLTIPKQDSVYDFPSDVDALVEQAADAGYEVDPFAAHWAWERYSDSMCAGWIILGDAEFNVMTLLQYLEVEDEPD
jgi:hypothetical protein